MKKSAWTVEALGDGLSGEFEVSVIRANNPMRGRSWGWFGKDKILVSHNGVTPVPINYTIWKSLIDLAGEVAAKMNEEEKARGRKIEGPEC